MNFWGEVRGQSILLLLLALAGAAHQFASPNPGGGKVEFRRQEDEQSFDVSVVVSLTRPIGPVNRLALGNNTQWVDRGDGLMIPNSLDFRPEMLRLVKEMAPTAIRYPSHVDVYHWRAGIGEFHERGELEHFFRKDRQKVILGTREALELCDELGATPLFMTNVSTGSAREAAEWVSYTNQTRVYSRTGKLLPKVIYWEIGNEPYLRLDTRPETWLNPAEYAARATEFIKAMKEADPAIQVGIPLRSDTIGGVLATRYPGYNQTVLQNLSAPFDFVVLHNSYFPATFNQTYTDDELYWGTMGASPEIEVDFAATREQLARFVPGKNIKLAVTEYNTFYGFSGLPSDQYINTITGAIYVADALRVFVTTLDLIMANFWSMTGNWYFGTIWSDTARRPSFHVLRLYNTALQGQLLPVSVFGKTFDSPRVGAAPARQNLPMVTSVATLSNGVLRTVLINKDPLNVARVSLSVDHRGRPGAISSARVETLTGKSSFDFSGLQISSQTLAPGAFPLTIDLPRSSITLVEVVLAERTRRPGPQRTG